MSTHDPRRGSEVAELAQLMPVPAERDLPHGRRHLLKEHLMTEFGNDQEGGRAAAPRPERRPRLPRRAGLATVAGAVTLAAALTAGGVWALNGAGGNGGSPGVAGRLTAARLLAKVADAAAKQKWVEVSSVTDSQFSYIDSQVSFGTNDGPAPAQTHRRQIWIPVANLCVSGLLIENGQQTVLNDSGASAVSSAKAGAGKPKPKVKAPRVKAGVKGGPVTGWTPVTMHCPSPGGLNDPTYRSLQALPTDPHALLDLINQEEQGAGQSTDQEAFTTIGDLLGESIPPPDVSAALYRAAALIPGVTVVPDVTDATGRPGVAVSFTSNGVQNEWIFDPHTFVYLGEREFINGTLAGKSAVITRAIVDHAGDVPSGS